MLKVKRGKGTQRCFSEVSESHHSPLVLVGAPTQGWSSPLIHARIKCSLRADSLTQLLTTWVGSSTSSVGWSPNSQSPPSRLGRDENGMDIFRPYSKLNPFRGVEICPYLSLDIQHPIPYPYPNTQIAYLWCRYPIVSYPTPYPYPYPYPNTQIAYLEGWGRVVFIELREIAAANICLSAN